MSDLVFLIFVVVAQIVPATMLVVMFILEIIKWFREANEERQRAQPVIVHQGAALAALDSRAAAAQLAARRREVLPYFPYAAQGRESETLCAICMEPLRQGQHCSEVPACRHAFHRDCLGAWARSKGTCPLCRAKIVPGSDGVAAAEDMV